MKITGSTTWLQTYRLPFSWSFSRDQVFRACKRQYYYRYYAPYGGNAPLEPGSRPDILVLGKLAGAAALVGTLVHNLARDRLTAQRQGQPWEDQGYLAGAREQLARIVRQSERACNKGVVNPKQRTLQAHYFGRQVDLDELVQRLDGYAHSLLVHPLFMEILAQAEHIVLLDEVRRFQVVGVTVFSVPDVVLYDNGYYRVIDWKTGTSYNNHPERLNMQLGLYALYLSRQTDAACQVISCEVAGIGDGSVLRWDMSPADIGAIEDYLIDSIKAMQGLLTNANLNQADRTRIPKRTEVVPGDEVCSRCAFRVLCFGVAPDYD